HVTLRDPHSFPTRRSSDLIVADVAEARRIALSTDEERLFGIDKLNVPRSEIPAVTHVDYSARVQTVHRETNPRYHALLSAFKAKDRKSTRLNSSHRTISYA